jgi:hypothetical protein
VRRRSNDLLPGSVLSTGGSDTFVRSDPSNPYHAYIEDTYGTRVVTASGVVCPTYSENCASDIVTVAAGIGATVTAAVPDLPSLVTVMVAISALPPRTAPAVTSPVDDTLAIPSFDDDHVSGRPVSTAPLVLTTDAVICTDWPYCSVPDVVLSDTLPTVRGAVGLSLWHALSTPKTMDARIRRTRIE